LLLSSVLKAPTERGENKQRLFLTSRPEIPIRNGFYEMSQEQHRDFVLHDISPSIIGRDISIFLTHNLQLIAKKNFLKDWPSIETVSSLVQRSQGLFIWAATVCRYIDGAFAEDQIVEVLAGDNNGASPEGHLNMLYADILRSCIRANYNETIKQKLHSLLRNVVGSIAAELSLTTELQRRAVE
jgi:hypothetical protein